YYCAKDPEGYQDDYGLLLWWGQGVL
nr:anti-SIV gp148 Ig heavy chain {CDR3 heavy chain region} [Macaca fascicularis=cynomolgus monkey, Peptide Partial, 25 aa] [Macaca fascicularis]